MYKYEHFIEIPQLPLIFIGASMNFIRILAFLTFLAFSEGRHTKRSYDVDIWPLARCDFQQCVQDLVRIFPMRNGFPLIRILRRSKVPILEEQDKTEREYEKLKEDHEKTMKRLRSKKEDLKKKVHTREKRAGCTTLLECKAMGMSIFKPRYITNLQGFNDRTVKYKDEFKNNAQIKVETMKLKKKNMLEEDELKKQIHEFTLAEKIRQIAELKEKTES